ncbi:hypothetical protein M422DRAFT_62313 [Sphaerobolus stellatus SS14]|uniref:phosphoribosylformylglycinamidine cyclo-ligase n=1 Tax=Sphaerobolus stellatus (strain SS14) TaxID=990650 RepID=A0A0C9UHT7_SPHS4|nr:hypothetical protein M422DRAFT_62313 [Sphaerobolus stellatus SS14]
MAFLKVLVIGSGGCEPLACIYIVPDNGGTQFGSKCPNVKIGSDDLFQTVGITIFSPTAVAVRMEGSNAFSKKFMAVFSKEQYEEACAYVRKCSPRLLLLAAGKDVLIPENTAEAQDHKRIGEVDADPNTGGMSTYAPALVTKPAVIDRIMKEALQPTINGMRKEGFHGSTGSKTDLATIMLVAMKRRMDAVEISVRSYAFVFHAYTSQVGNDIATVAEPVVAVAAHGATIQETFTRVDVIEFEGKAYRRDIAHRYVVCTESYLTYVQAGVSVDAGNELVQAIKSLVHTTRRSGDDADIGRYGGVFDPKAMGYKDPVLVSRTDGVGTKLCVAFDFGVHDTVSVAMSANDVQGIEPLYFYDYCDIGVATDVINGCFAIGTIELLEILPRVSSIKASDVLLEIPSSSAEMNDRVKALVHIISGGFIENIPEYYPVLLHLSMFEHGNFFLSLFEWLMRTGAVAPREMSSTFNCGSGMVAVVAKEDEAAVRQAFTSIGVVHCDD